MLLSKALPALAATLMLATGTADAASLPAGSTALLSGGPSLFDAFATPVNDAWSTAQATSADGRFVTFVSESDGLLEGDDDTVTNVYLKDMDTGVVTLMSRADGAAGEPSHDECGDPVISDDGLAVAFRCQGALDEDDTNATGDIYVRRPQDESIVLASRATDEGPVGDARSFAPSISLDGEYVAFTSDANNLDPLAADGYEHVFRRHLRDGRETVLISRRPELLSDSAVPARDASISDSGDIVAYVTHVAMDDDDTNDASDVYVRTHSAGMTVLASRAAGGGGDVGNRASQAPALAGDGSTVAFQSEASNLDPTLDTDTRPDVYWRVLTGGQNTALVNTDIGGHKGVDSTAPSISTDGNVVGFVSEATNIDPDDVLPERDAYVKNMLTSTLEVVSRRTGPQGIVANADARAVAVSGDAKKAVVYLDAGGITPDADPRLQSVIRRDLVGKTTASVARPVGDAPFVNAGGKSGAASLSADGRFAAFDSEAGALGLPHGRARGIFVRDRVTGTVSLVSREDGPEGTPFTGKATDPDISADGRRVAFTVLPPSSNGSPMQVWVRDIVEGRTWLASRADGAIRTAGNAGSYDAALDADGTRVTFTSEATNLGDGDGDSRQDIHVRDLETDRTFLVSTANGTGPKGDSSSHDSDIDGGGTRVTFISSAANLGDGDPDNQRDVHLRDLAAGTTQLVSATADGVKSNGDSNDPTIDAAGQRVAFSAAATNLLGATSPGYKVFVRDLAAGTLVIAGRGDGVDGAIPDGGATFPVISPDGGFVAFSGDDLAPGVPPSIDEVYVRDLAAGRTELVSRRDGADGEPAQDYAYATSISEDGGCVAFETDNTLVGPRSDFQQSYLRARRADCGQAPEPEGDGPAPAGGGTPDPGPQGAAPDTIAPTLTDVRLRRRRFRVARAATALSAAAKRGTVLTFRSSEAATLTIVVQRWQKRFRRAGRLTRNVRAGAGRVALSGKLGRRRLASGRYRLVLTARDAGGNRSRPARVAFTIVKG